MRALVPVLVALLALPALSAAAQAPSPPAPPSPPGQSAAGEGLQLEDRIVAVVDEDPVVASDIDRLIGLGLAVPNPGEDERAFRRRVLEQLIEQRLRFHEIDRFGFVQVPVDEIERQVAEIRARYASEEEFERRLRELGLSLTSLRQLVARQIMVWNYVDERLGPRVFVTYDDIKNYYDTVLVPEMQRQGQAVPPIEQVREQIRSLLKDQRLNEELEKWTEELRQRADVANFFDAETGPPLPPVVLRVDRPAEGGAEPPQ
jgi:hypothetical protein